MGLCVFVWCTCVVYVWCVCVCGVCDGEWVLCSLKMWRRSQAWTLVKEAPVVSGATAQQLVVWLTYHRAIGERTTSKQHQLAAFSLSLSLSHTHVHTHTHTHTHTDAEFADTFLLTYPSFMSPEQLLNSLISRYIQYT